MTVQNNCDNLALHSISVHNKEVRLGMKPYERIASYIRLSGLKQKAIAERAGYSERQLSAMLNGKRKLWADDYERLCSALGKTPNDFMDVIKV